MARKYTRIKYKERKTIEQLFKNGASVAYVAERLGTHRDTIYKELKRAGLDQKNYTADAAQATL